MHFVLEFLAPAGKSCWTAANPRAVEEVVAAPQGDISRADDCPCRRAGPARKRPADAFGPGPPHAWTQYSQKGPVVVKRQRALALNLAADPRLMPLGTFFPALLLDALGRLLLFLALGSVCFVWHGRDLIFRWYRPLSNSVRRQPRRLGMPVPAQGRAVRLSRGGTPALLPDSTTAGALLDAVFADTRSIRAGRDAATTADVLDSCSPLRSTVLCPGQHTRPRTRAACQPAWPSRAVNRARSVTYGVGGARKPQRAARHSAPGRHPSFGATAPGRSGGRGPI
jgi:hypothetical protein